MNLDDLLKGLPSEATKAVAISTPVPKRALIPLIVKFVKDLSRLDLALPPDPSQCVPIHVKALRDRHHDLAKLIAAGDQTHTDIARETGYTVSRVSILMTDPAFLDIVEHYRGEVKEIFRSSQERLADLMRESADVMLERLDEDPDSFTVNNLLEIIKTTADRTGDGPTSTQRIEGSITVASADSIAAIKERVRDRQNGRATRINQEAIEVEVIDSTIHEPNDIPIGNGELLRLETGGDTKRQEGGGKIREGAEIRSISGKETVKENCPR